MAAPKSSGAKAEVALLIKAVKANGFNVVPGGSGHKKVVDKHGKTVTDKDGPLLISSSPSEVRWRDMHVSRLMKAKVLKEDPWNPNPPERSNRLRDPDVQQKKREAIQRQSDARQERTRKIRAKLEPLVARLGGWDKHGFITDLGRVQYQLAKSRGRVETPKNMASAIQNARQMKLGGTLSDSNALCWELLVDDLERHDRRDPEHGLLVRWQELQREARGLPIEHEADEPLASSRAAVLEIIHEHEEPTLPAHLPAAPSQNGGDPHPAQGPPLPSLALEAMAYMGRGAGGKDEMDRVLVLGEKIARLELEGGS